MVYKLKSNRVYRSYFGGCTLDEMCGKEKCEISQFPEEWIASTVRAFNVGREDIVEGLSLTEDGKLLCDIISENPREILGEKQYGRFRGEMSILVKLVDPAERLFIQCHPTIPFAKEQFHSNFGKTECWYILSADENACVYLGFKEGITKEKWKKCFEDQDVDEMLNLMHRLKVKRGDLVFVEGGVPHAIGSGCLICELQEPTDYMVIPERKSKSGVILADKKMHGGLGWEKMFDCFEYEGFTEEALRERFVRHSKLEENKLTDIVDESLTDKFKMKALHLEGTASLGNMESFAVMVVIDGECILTCDGRQTKFKKGEQCFISANSGEIEISGNAKLVMCLP